MPDDSDVIDVEYTTTIIKSWKAQAIDPKYLTPDLVISFDEDLPEFDHRAGHFVYRAEADRIVRVLACHLPGGLLDAIFASLCAHKASVLRVPGSQARRSAPGEILDFKTEMKGAIDCGSVDASLDSQTDKETENA